MSYCGRIAARFPIDFIKRASYSPQSISGATRLQSHDCLDGECRLRAQTGQSK